MKISALKQAEWLLSRMGLLSPEWIVIRTREHVQFAPIWVRQYAEPFLFAEAQKVVMASATIVPYELQLLGLKKEEYDFFEYSSPFPVERRPIYYYPVVRMHHGMDAEDSLAWINVADEFIAQRLDRKGFIPTGSFARTKMLLAHSKFAPLMIANLSRESAMSTLQKFRAHPAPAILVTPSIISGVDLKYKQAEYAIVPKVPFEPITDPLYVARSSEDPEYGLFQAGKTLDQLIGRIMRAEDDHGETLITDAAFAAFFRNKRMLSKSFWEAFRIVDELPRPLELL